MNSDTKPLAPLLERFIAMVIDSVIVGLVSLLLNRFIFLGWILSLIFNFLYYPFFIASEVRATPGKFLMGITVVSVTGERLTIKKAIIRYIGSFVSGICLCLGYCFAFFTQNKQTLHDLFAGTIVILDKREAEEGLFNAWLAQIKTEYKKIPLLKG